MRMILIFIFIVSYYEINYFPNKCLHFFILVYNIPMLIKKININPNLKVKQMATIIINDVQVDSSAQIEFKQNPKRSGSKAHSRYDRYQVATTLDEFFEIVNAADDCKKYARADLRYDHEHGFLIIPTEETDEIES